MCVMEWLDGTHGRKDAWNYKGVFGDHKEMAYNIFFFYNLQEFTCILDFEVFDAS